MFLMIVSGLFGGFMTGVVFWPHVGAAALLAAPFGGSVLAGTVVLWLAGFDRAPNAARLENKSIN